MKSFEQKLNEIFSSSGIPFVDYGIVNSESNLIEGLFRNSQLSQLSKKHKVRVVGRGDIN